MAHFKRKITVNFCQTHSELIMKLFTAFVNILNQQEERTSPSRRQFRTSSTEIFEAVVFHFLLPTKVKYLPLFDRAYMVSLKHRPDFNFPKIIH